tara:strand:+ start:246 stop:371 length:126 start_codon:yes stop_codon:yes gene_type:complete
MMETILAVIFLGGVGFIVAGLVIVALMKMWFWMDENERNDR